MIQDKSFQCVHDIITLFERNTKKKKRTPILYTDKDIIWKFNNFMLNDELIYIYGSSNKSFSIEDGSYNYY